MSSPPPDNRTPRLFVVRRSQPPRCRSDRVLALWRRITPAAHSSNNTRSLDLSCERLQSRHPSCQRAPSRTLCRKTRSCILLTARQRRASLRLEASALPPLARLSQTTVRVLGRFRELLHLTSTARAERLPSLCRLRSFLNFSGDRRFKFRARIRAAVGSDTLLRHSSARLGLAVVTRPSPSCDGSAFSAITSVCASSLSWHYHGTPSQLARPS